MCWKMIKKEVQKSKKEEKTLKLMQKEVQERSIKWTNRTHLHLQKRYSNFKQ